MGKVDEILGTIQEVYFSVKPADGISATSFKPGDKLYISEAAAAAAHHRSQRVGRRRRRKGQGQGGGKGGKGGGRARAARARAAGAAQAAAESARAAEEKDTEIGDGWRGGGCAVERLFVVRGLRLRLCIMCEVVRF